MTNDELDGRDLVNVCVRFELGASFKTADAVDCLHDFPLTPALSPVEREGEAVLACSSEVAGFDPAQRTH